MSIPLPVRRRFDWRRLAVIVVAEALVASSLTFVAQTPASAEPRREAPAVQQTRSAAVRPGVVKPRPPDPVSAAAKLPTPPPVWPEPTSTVVNVGATASTPLAARAPRSTVAGEQKIQSVRLGVLPKSAAEQAGLSGLLLTAARADSGTAEGKFTLDVDYSKYATAFGGDWASRLRLIAMPSCVVATPKQRSCATGKVIPSRNDVRNRRVTAEVQIPGASAESRQGQSHAETESSTAYFALAAGASGGAGDYSATSLSASSSWQVGEQTGDFTWSYPFRTPPPIAGPGPQLGISYSSGSVDGRVASTNNQPSWLGEGHSLEVGYVERKYISCADDMTGGNNTEKTGDQCWKSNNASVVLGGHSGELVPAGTNTWRLKNDDASKIDRLTGAPNGAQSGEYWRLTTTDGTQYYFGITKRSGADTGNTNSTFTSPVFGNQANEPCHKDTFAASYCNQAYRWNLDYVVDVNGNTITYNYQVETNNYGRNANKGVSSYERGGWLSNIEYGERRGAEHTTTAPARIDFAVAERCLPSPTFDCDPAKLTSANAGQWPDVPFDQICTSTTSCPNGTSPTFFSRKRLVGITTKMLSGSSYVDVDSWSLTQDFLNPGDGTSKDMFLTSIVHTGKVGGSAAMPPITFTPAQLANRVDGTDIAPPMYKFRIAAIYNDTGGRITVNYNKAECSPGAGLPASPWTNTKRCMPVYWAAEGQSAPTLNYFHKYPVVSVLEEDLVAQATTKTYQYDYLDTPAWHYDDNEFTPAKYRTWGDWRGYSRVQVRTGVPTGQQSAVEHRYMRGMDKDRLPNGGVRPPISLPDSQGGSVVDHARLNGYLHEEITFNGAGGPQLSGNINTPWISAATANNGDDHAYLLGTASSVARTALAAGGWRKTQTNTVFDAYGMATTVDDLGDVTTDADDLCGRTTYNRNLSLWLMSDVASSETVSVNCATTPSRPADIVGAEATYFDGATTLDAAPTHGNATMVTELSDWKDGAPVYTTRSKAVYDDYGRVSEAYDPLGQKATTEYTPATGGPVTAVVTTNALGHKHTSTIDPALGLPIVEIDANGKRTDLTYDPLGRLTAVWLPTRPKSANASTPNMKFSYLVRNNGPSVITTEELQNGGNYVVSTQLFDGLLRPRQTQTPTPRGGVAVTETIFDARGLTLDENGPTWNSTATPGNTLLVINDVDQSAQSRTTYDGAGRPISTALRVRNQEKWHNTTVYGGDRVTVTPPDGGTVTTTIADARGRTTSLRQHHDRSVGSAFDETKYTYTPDGKPESVTDPAGNVWRYTYDIRGRLVQSDDPDRGRNSTAYDNADQVVSTTDARGKTLAYTYDDLGRRTSMRDGSSSGAVRASWEYDTLAKGHATSSTRWIGENAYKTAVTGYDDAYRPTGSTITIPSNEGGLAGNYTTALTYNLDGGVRTQKLPAVPGIREELLDFRYDKLGNPKALIGNGGYVAASTYSPFGDLLQLTLSQELNKENWLSFEYEEGTNRLTRSRVDRAGSTSPDVNTTYSYDPTGNLLRSSDAAAKPQTDTQCFGYDYLRRMTDAWTPASGDCAAAPSGASLGGPAPYWQSYTFDVVGNRLTKTQHATTASGPDVKSTYTYPAAGQPRPHALSKVVTDGPSGQRLETFGYDAAGNTVSRNVAGDDQPFTWDAEGELVSAGAASGQLAGDTTFVADADGDRLLRHDPKGATLYLDSGTEVRLDKASGALSSTRYYTIGGRTVAVKSSATGTISFLAADPNGTAETSINGATLAVEKKLHDPFGGTRGAAPSVWPGARGFVGGTEDTSIGLTQLGARSYDSANGRFLSVDPVIDPGDPQQLNAYAYANNSPVTFSDPDGLRHGDIAQHDQRTLNEQRLHNMRSGNGGGSSGGGSGSKGKQSSAVDDANASVAAARAARAKALAAIKNIGKQALQIAMDELGITDGISCFTTGDFGACAATAVNVLSMFVGGVAGKIITRYGVPWKWAKAAKLAERLWKLGGDAIEAVSSWFKASAALGRAEKALSAVKTAATKAAAAAKQAVGAAGKACNANSFLPGTAVLMADGKRKAIDQIKVGDKVVATDPLTGKTAVETVAATIVGAGVKSLVEVTLDVDGAKGSRTGAVVATEGHPFWVVNERAWVDASKLHVGDVVRTPTGVRLQVVALARWTTLAKVHNLTIGNAHTYHVLAGATPVLVHNSGPGCGSVWIDSKKVDHHFKHAEDFGVTGKANKASRQAFVGALSRFVRDPGNVQISGTYRGTPARHYVDLNSGRHVSVDIDSGKLLGAWRTNIYDDQFWYLTMQGKL